MTTASFKLTIPKPCHNNWEEMLPNEKGRHCLDCNKTVIDFTNFTDEAIRDYFAVNPQSACGRFYKKQLDRIIIRIPNYILQKKLPRWKQFLLLLLICFGSMVLPVEVNAHNTKHAFTETTDKKDKVNKKKKHYKRKRRAYDYINPEIFYTISGFTISTPEPPITVNSPYYNDSLKIIVDDKTKVSVAQEDISKRDKPAQKKPYQPIEATLPVAMSTRVIGKKKKK